MAKANYDLPEKTLKEVIRLSGAKTKREALILSMEAYLKRKKLDQLIQSRGKISLAWTQQSLKKYRK